MGNLVPVPGLLLEGFDKLAKSVQAAAETLQDAIGRLE